MPKKSLVSSTIQTLLSVPELHRFNPARAGLANYHRRSGISASWLITLPRRNLNLYLRTIFTCRQKYCFLNNNRFYFGGGI